MVQRNNLRCLIGECGVEDWGDTESVDSFSEGYSTAIWKMEALLKRTVAKGKELRSQRMKDTAIVLTEGQIGWIVEVIRSTKENCYLGDDFDDAMDDWDPERSELHPDELVDLKALLDAVRPKG